MTYTALVAKVCDYCNLTSTEAQARVGRSINAAYRRVTSMVGLDAARFVARTVTTTSGDSSVTFTEIEKIDRVVDVTTASAIRLLPEVSIHEMRSTQPTTGAPTIWALRNTDADSVVIQIDTQPAADYDLRAEGWTTLSDLSGSDEPAFPESFHDILVWFVIAEEMLKKDKDKLSDRYTAKAEKLLSDLRFYLADSPTLETRQGDNPSSGVSGSSGSGTAVDGTNNYTQSGLITFDRSGLAPFAVASGSAYVDNLIADDVRFENTDRLLGRDTSGAGTSEEITVGGGIEFTGSAGIQTSAFTGDVTKSAGGTAQTIANDAVTYAKMQNVSATSRILGRKTVGAGDVEECTLSEVLDFISSAAHGDILYRGSSAWARLAAGTSGQFLQTLGSSANPAWAWPEFAVCEGRLTGTTAVPVTTSDVTGATSIYFTPFRGNRIGLYDGSSAWNVRTFSEITLSLSGFTASKPYDIFAYDNSGTAALEALVWTDATNRATALTTQNGVLVKTGATTRRYLGTIYINSSGGQTDDSYAKRNIWNYYNRQRRPMRVLESTNTWTYNSNTLRQANGAAGNQLEFTVGVAEVLLDAMVIVSSSGDSGGDLIVVGIGFDSTSALASGCINVSNNAQVTNFAQTQVARYQALPAVGRHTVVWLEAADSTVTFVGDSGGSLVQSGIIGSIEG